MLRRAGFSKSVKLTEVIIATLLIVCFVICLLAVVYSEDIGFYTSRPDDYNETRLSTQFIEQNNFDHIENYLADVLNGRDISNHLDKFSYEKTNVRFVVLDKSNSSMMLTNIHEKDIDGFLRSPSKMYKSSDIYINAISGVYYVEIRIYAADEMLVNDDISKGYTLYNLLSKFSEAALVVGVVFAVASFVCVYGLICLSGHRWNDDSSLLTENAGRIEKDPELESRTNIRGVIKFVSADEVIERNMMDKIPLDVLIALIAGWVSIAIFMVRAFPSPSTSVFFTIAIYTILGIFGFIIPAIALAMTIATRAKLGGILENTVIYRIFVRPFVLVFSNLSDVWKTAVAFVAYLLGTVICVLLFFRSVDNPLVRYVSMFAFFFLQLSALYRVCVRSKRFSMLHRKARQISEGNFGEPLDAYKMEGEYREHAQFLNSINESVSNAVEERLKSERLRTELITNVSHDIKTPLTSIVNYVDILRRELWEYNELQTQLLEAYGRQRKSGEDQTDPAGADINAHDDPDGNLRSLSEVSKKRLLEYMATLEKNSGKLKKLIEDLVEASKAATGNINVTISRVNLGELINQTIGEYEEKLEAAGLTVPVKMPEGGAFVSADGRLLWRVFDNLFSNACKYAQSGTRFYINVEKKDKSVIIVMRNVSRDVLNNSPEELVERFSRGDGARTSEGSGLGLSIAQSLIVLQNGTLGIGVDGDLFKVTIVLPEAGEEGKEVD